MNTQPHSRRSAPLQAHVRERTWQIWLPMILAALIILAIMVLVILTSTGAGNNVGQWASVSLIFLILPAFMITLVFLALTAGLAVGITLLIRKLPGLADRILALLGRLQQIVSRGMQRAASPVITVRSSTAGWRRLKAITFRRSSRSVSH